MAYESKCRHTFLHVLQEKKTTFHPLHHRNLSLQDDWGVSWGHRFHSSANHTPQVFSPFCSLSILPLNWTLSVTAVVWIQLVLPHLTNRLCCLFALRRIYGSKWKENWRSASLSFSNYFTKPYLFPLLEWKCIGKENHFWTWWLSSLSIAV